MITRGKQGIFIPKAFLVNLDTTKPTNVKHVFRSPHWHQAMQLEYEALVKNHIWDIVPLPTDTKVVGCK